MKLPLKRSNYLLHYARESTVRQFIRWLYTTYLDELYIPDGAEIQETPVALNRHSRYILKGIGTTKVRRGMQEHYFK